MEKFFSKPIVRVIIAVFCTLLWGTAYPLIKLGYRQMNIETIPDMLMFASLRYLLAGVLLFIPLLFIRREELFIEKKRVPIVIIFGLVQTGLMYMFNYIGVANTSATKTSVLTSLSAFFAVIFAPLVFKDDKLTIQKIEGCIVGFIGILIVNINFLSGSFTFFGEGFIIIAMLLNTAAGFIGKVAGKGKPFGVTSYQLLIGGLFLFIVSILFGGTIHISTDGFIILILLSIVSSIAFALWTVLLIYNDVSKVLVFNLLCPIFGAMFSFIILGENEIFDPLYILSIILVSIGIVLVNSNFKKRKKEE